MTNETGFTLQGQKTVQGINIDIENKAGSTREGTDKDGHAWATKMKYDYGYIRGTKGHDKEHIDVYIGPDQESDLVFVVHQNDPVTGAYDEDKVMIGFSSADSAKEAYLSQYDRPGFFGDMAETTIADFKRELMDNAENNKTDMSLGKWVSQADADPLAPILDPGAELPIQSELLDGSPAQVEPYTGMDDLAIAQKMATGEIPGIVATDKCLLVPMRITGTGVSTREKKDENQMTVRFEIDRPADVFLSDRFLQMCAGLPVAYLHPDAAEGGFTSINYDNWREYIVGTIFYPFIKDTEVWGVAKVFDLSMLDAFKAGIVSTSPFVTSESVPGANGMYVEKLEDINHVAIVSAGHWDTETPAIAANIEIQTKEDLMADEKDPKDTVPADKADANLTQVTPAAVPEKKPDADPAIPAAGDNQPAEDARMGKLEAAVASLTEGMAGIKASLDALVASDKAVHEEVAADPVEGPEDEAKAQDVKALTEMADAAHTEVKIVKPVPQTGESHGEYIRRVLAHNKGLLDAKYHGLATAKIDASNMELAKDAFNNIGENAQKKSAELYKTAGKNKNVYIPAGNGMTVDQHF